MVTLLKWFLIPIGVICLAVVLFLAGMRFHDGPIEIVSGGPFTTGTPAESPDDWGFLRDRFTIEFQTLHPATSRTTWCAVKDGRLFIVSGYMTTILGRIWKHWPYYVADDDRVILRIDGKLYKERLVRIQSGELVAPVMAEFGRKYNFVGVPEAVTSGYTWMFEVVRR